MTSPIAGQEDVGCQADVFLSNSRGLRLGARLPHYGLAKAVGDMDLVESDQGATEAQPPRRIPDWRRGTTIVLYCNSTVSAPCCGHPAARRGALCDSRLRNAEQRCSSACPSIWQIDEKTDGRLLHSSPGDKLPLPTG